MKSQLGSALNSGLIAALFGAAAMGFASEHADAATTVRNGTVRNGKARSESAAKSPKARVDATNPEAQSPSSVFNSQSSRQASAPGWYYVPPAPSPMPPAADSAPPQAAAIAAPGLANSAQPSLSSSGGQLSTAARRPRKAAQPSLFRVTPVAGATVMGLKNDANDDVASPDVGLAVGTFADFGRGLVTFQTGLIYNQFGGKAETPKGDEVYVLDYLSIPLVAKLNAMKNPDGTLYLKGGLMPSVFLDGKTKNQTASKSVEARALDVAAVGGLGVALSVSRENSLIFDAQYVRSVTNLTDDDRLVRHEGFVFMGGISIAL